MGLEETLGAKEGDDEIVGTLEGAELIDGDADG